jgi:sec-independent protein translocase protein TatB
MFDVGWSEMLVIAVVLIVVVGPKDLPRMLRQFGRTTAKLRAMAGDFRRQFDEALKEAELDDVSDAISSVRKINPMNEIRKHLAPIEDVGQQVRAGLDDVMKPQAKPVAAETSAEPVAAEPLKNGAVEMPGDTAPVVRTAKPARAARTRATAAKSSAAKAASSKAAAPAKAAAKPAAKAAAKPAAKAAAAKAAPLKTSPAKAPGKSAPSKPPVSKPAVAAAPKAAKPATAGKAPAKTGSAGRKKTGSAR